MASSFGTEATVEHDGQVFRAWRPPYRGAIEFSVGADVKRSIPLPPQAVRPEIRAKLFALLGVK